MSANKPKTIEELAYAIKFNFNEYRKTEISKFKSDLAAKLLEKLNLKAFSRQNLSVNEQLSQSWKNEQYDGEIFAKAFKSSMEKYGQKDEETGEQLPFIQIFLSHYGMKKPQIRINKLKEANYLVEIKQKSEYINLFLQQQAKKWGNKKLPKDFKVWKYEQCVEFLKSLNADEEEISRAINKLADLFTDKYMKRILPVDEEDNDSKVESVNDMVNTEDNVKSEVIDKMTSMLDTALSEVETSLEMYARYYITMKIVLKYKISGFYNQMIDDYVDKGLEKFYYEKYSQYIDEKYIKDIVADYVGKRPDTVRKKLDRVKKIIQNSMLKNMARR